MSFYLIIKVSHNCRIKVNIVEYQADPVVIEHATLYNPAVCEYWVYRNKATFVHLSCRVRTLFFYNEF